MKLKYSIQNQDTDVRRSVMVKSSKLSVCLTVDSKNGVMNFSCMWFLSDLFNTFTINIILAKKT